MKTIVAIITALTLTGGAVIADEASQPKVISDGELDKIVAGTGRDNVADHAWDILGPLGFAPTHNAKADKGVIDHAGFTGVLVPRRP